MPLVFLWYKADRDLRELAEKLAQALPGIIGPELTVVGRDRHEGWVAPQDVIVRFEAGSVRDVNAKDIEILIKAHDYPERVVNQEERKDAIIQGIRRVLGDFDRDISGYVWLELKPIAFGQL